MFKQFTTTTTSTTIPLIVVDEFQIFPHIQNEFMKSLNASKREEDNVYSTVLLNTKYKSSSLVIPSQQQSQQQQQLQQQLLQTIPLIQSSNDSSSNNDSTITVPRIQLQFLTTTTTPITSSQPLLHLYFLQCDDVDVYKRIIKQQLKLFIESINKTKKGNDYVIVYVSYGSNSPSNTSNTTTGSSTTSTSSSSNSSVLDKLKSDFPSKKIIHFKANNNTINNNSNNDNSVVLDSIVSSQLDLSFSYLTQLHDESTQKEQQQLRLPGFNYFSYFIVKLNISFVLESLGYCDLSLRQLEHLFDLMQSSLDIILVQGMKEGELVSWGEYFGEFSFDFTTDAAAAVVIEKKKMDYLELIRRNQITVLDFSLFLILNQLRLLKLLCSNSASNNKQYLRNLYLKKVKNYLVDITCTYYKYRRGNSTSSSSDSDETMMKVAGWMYSFIMEVLEYYDKELYSSSDAASVDGSSKSSLLADLLYDAKVQLDKITTKLKYTPQLLQGRFDLDYSTISHAKEYLEQNVCSNSLLIDALLDFSWKYVQLYEGIVEKIVFNCSASNSRIVPLVYYDLCLLYYHSYNHFRLGINKNQKYDAERRDGTTAEDHFKSLLLKSITLMKQHVSPSVKDVLNGVEINPTFTKNSSSSSSSSKLSPIDEHCMMLLKNLYYSLEIYNEYLRVLLGLVVVVVSETPSRSAVYLKEFLRNRDKMIKYSTDLIRLQLEQLFNIVSVDFVENQYVDLILEGIFHEDDDNVKSLSPDEQLEVYSVQLQAFGSQDLTFKSDSNNCSLKLDGITKIRLKVSSSSVTAISSDSLVLGDLEVQLDDCNTITLIHSFMSEKSKVIFDVVKDERSTDVEFRKPRLTQTDSHQFILDQNDNQNGESQEWIEMEIVVYGGQRGIDQGARLTVQYAPVGGDVNRGGEFKLNKIDFGEEQDDLYEIENNSDSTNCTTIVLKNRVKSMELQTIKVLVKFPEYYGDDYYNEGCFIDGLKLSLEFHSISSTAESDNALPPDLHKIVREFNNVFIMNLLELEEVLEDGQQLILRNQYSHPLRILTDMKADKSFPSILYADQVLHYYKEDLSELRIDFIPVDLELVIVAENILSSKMDSYQVLQPRKEYYKRFLGYLLFKYYLSDIVIKKYWLNGSTKLSFKQAGVKSENRSNIFTEYFRNIQFIVGLSKLENAIVERKASTSEDSVTAALCAILDEAEGLSVKKPEKKIFPLFDEFKFTFHYWNTLRDIKAIGEVKCELKRQDHNAYVKVGELVSMVLSIDYKKFESNAVDDLKVLVSFQNDNPNWLIIGKIKKNIVIKDGNKVVMKLVLVPLKVGIVQIPEFDVTVTNIVESETYLYKVKQEKDNVMLIHPRHKTKSFFVDLNPNDIEAQNYPDFARSNINFNASGRLTSVHSKMGLASPFGPGSDSRRLGTSSVTLFSPAVTKLNEFQVPEDQKLDDNDSIEKEYFDQSRATASVPASPVGQSLDRSQSNLNNAPFSNASESNFPRGSYSTTTSAKWNWLNPASIGSAIMKHAKSTSFSGTGTSCNKRRNSQNRI